MSSKAKVLGGVLALALLSWFAEYGYLKRVYTPRLMGNMIEEFGAQIEGLDKAVLEKIQNGYFKRFLIIESISRDRILELRNIHPLVREAVVFSANRHIMSSTTGNYTLGEAVNLFDILSQNRRPLDYVTGNGYERIYPIYSNGDGLPEGFVTFILRIPRMPGDSISFAANPGRKAIYFDEGAPLSAGEKAYFHEKLLGISMMGGAHETISLDKKWDIYWGYDGAKALYFGSLQPAAGVFAYTSFYITLACLAFSLSFLMKERGPKNQKLSILEESLLKNRETLQVLKENISDLAESASAMNYPDFDREKVVSETSAEGLAEGGYGPTTYGIGATPTPKMDFILLNPLEERWIEPLIKDSEGAGRLREIADDLRDRVFSEELKELMDEVGSPSDTDFNETVERIRSFEEEFGNTELNSFGESLRQIYSGDIAGEEMEVPLMHLSRLLSADGMMLMSYDKKHSCFVVSVCSGIEEDWRKSFYLLRQDSIFPFDDEKGGVVDFDAEKISNPFLKKRIPEADLNEVAGLRIIPMMRHNVMACLVAVYKHGELSQEGGLAHGLRRTKSVRIEEALERSLQEMAPLVYKMQSVAHSYHAQEHYKEAIQELKSVIEGGSEKVLVVHAELEKPLSMEAYSHVEDLCRRFLKPDERLLLLHPRHLIFYLTSSSEGGAKRALEEINQSIEWRAFRFPDDGRNFLYYL